MSTLPTGTVTFVLTDVEGSCPLWETDARAMDAALVGFDEQFGVCVARHGGVLVVQRGEGDSHFAAFDQASKAVTAAVEAQRHLAGADDFRVRIALHTAEVRPRGGNYYGTGVNRAARLRTAAHGGQIVVSRLAAELARDSLARDVSLRSLGVHRIRDWPRSDEVFQVEAPGLRAEFPPLLVAGAERVRLMTVVALDLVQGRTLLTTVDGEGFASGQRTFGKVVRGAFEGAGGMFLKLMGDGVLATFDDPLRALDFTQSVHRWADTTGWCFRSALHAGRIEVLDEDIAGEALIIASKLVHRAEAGQTLVTQTVTDLVGVGGIEGAARAIDLEGRTWTVHAIAHRGREP